MKNKQIFLLLLVGFMVISPSVRAESVYSKKYIGGSLAAGFALDGHKMSHFDMGLHYEHQFAKHFSYEVGFDVHNQLLCTNLMDVHMHYLAFPVGVNVVSHIMNFGVGVTPKVYAGFSVIAPRADGTYTIDTAPFDFGLYAKLSKNIQLNERLVLEPVIALKTVYLMSQFLLDFSLRLKYEL